MFLKICFIVALSVCLSGCSGGPSQTPSNTPSATAGENPVAGEHSQQGEHNEGEEDTKAGHPASTEPSEHEKEGEVNLKPEQLRLIGVVAASVAVREIRPRLSLPATIVADPDLEVKIAARVAGIVESIDVRVGDHVRQGQVVATLSSPEVARLKVDYQGQMTERELASSNLNRRVGLARLGDVTRRPFEEAQKELAQARTSVDTTAAQLQLSRKKLERLELLLRDGIASPQQVDEARAAVREARARFGQAQTDSQIAVKHLQRESSIQSSGLQVDSEAFQANAEIRRRAQGAESLRQALLAFGTDPDAPGGRVEIHSPIDGIVTARPKALGEQAQAGDLLLSVLDPNRVWAWVDLPQDAITSVQLQSQTELKVSAYPQRTFTGRLTFVSPEADPDTKKIRARVELRNEGLQLRPNMLAQVMLGVGASRKVLAVPAEALVQMENRPVVYVQEEPGKFHRRAVELGAKAAGWVEIRQGLRVGDLIAVKGVPALRAEDQRASSGEEGHGH